MSNPSCSYFRVMLEDGLASCRLGIWVQFEHYPQVLQRILLQYSANDLLSAMTVSARLINMHQHLGRHFILTLLLRTSITIRTQKHGPEVEHHHL